MKSKRHKSYIEDNLEITLMIGNNNIMAICFICLVSLKPWHECVDSYFDWKKLDFNVLLDSEFLRATEVFKELDKNVRHETSI